MKQLSPPGYSPQTWNPIEKNYNRLQQPLTWKKPRFVRLADIFDGSLRPEQMAAILGVIAINPNHIFYVPTERPDVILDLFDWLYRADVDPWTECHYWALKNDNKAESIHQHDYKGDCSWPLPNLWLGARVPDQPTADVRIPLLLQTPAAVRVLHCEPLLSEIDLGLNDFICPKCAQRQNADHTTCVFCNEYLGIDSMLKSMISFDQVIIGGESGSKARICDIDWIRSLLKQCKAADVPAFVKQLGSRPVYVVKNAKTPGMASNVLEGTYEYHVNGKGENPAEWPEDLRVREWSRALAGGGV